MTQKLIGLRKDTSEEIPLTIPEDYRQRDLAGKEVRVTVKIKGLKQKVLPDLDDSFAKDLGEDQGLESLKKKLKSDLEKEEKRRIESLVRIYRRSVDRKESFGGTNLYGGTSDRIYDG